MARLGYLAVLMVVLGSVGFGLDWQSAPMSPMPDVKLAVQHAPTSPVPRSQSDGPNGALSPVYPASPGPQQTVGTAAAAPAAGSAASEAPRASCNVSACASAYHSFQAADCSYQPNNGPRRRCAKK